MRAVILAAGKGARLNDVIGNKPKCLLRLGDKTLIERQIDALHDAGIDDVVAVVGCEHERVKRTCGRRISYIENARYAQTNSLYSLWLARPLLVDGFVVMNCDVLFHPQMLTDLLTTRYDDALLMSDNGETLGDEEMKIKARRGCVVEISKELAPGDADGENVGMAKFGAEGARLLSALLDARMAAGGVREWVPHAFADFARRRPLHVVGTRGYPWTEIDFPEDYAHAVNNVLPAIDGDGAAVTEVRVKGDATVVVHGLRLGDPASLPLSRAGGE